MESVLKQVPIQCYRANAGSNGKNVDCKRAPTRLSHLFSVPILDVVERGIGLEHGPAMIRRSTSLMKTLMLQHNERYGREAAVQGWALPDQPATDQAQVHACQVHEDDSGLYSSRGLPQGTVERCFPQSCDPGETEKLGRQEGRQAEPVYN